MVELRSGSVAYRGKSTVKQHMGKSSKKHSKKER